MSTASQYAFLRRLVRGGERMRGPDPGDMGTAFGLDYSLDESTPATEPPAVRRATRAGALLAAWRSWLVRKLGY